MTFWGGAKRIPSTSTFFPYQPLHKHEAKKEKKEMIPYYFDIFTVRSLQVKEVSFPSQNKRGKENSL